MEERTNKEIVDLLIKGLKERMGFHYWWNNLYIGTRKEIVTDLVGILDESNEPEETEQLGFYCIMPDGCDIKCETQCFRCKYRNNLR